MQRRARLGLTAAAVLVLCAQGVAAPQAGEGFVGAYDWQMDDPLFGGFSALELGPDGLSFIALSDRGAWTRGTLTRAPDGTVTGVTAEPLQKLRATGEAPLKTSRSDSEGMAVAADGTIFVSFEGVARVLRYSAFGGPAENLPTPEEFRRQPKNASFEALAIDGQGRLYAMAEDTRGGTGPFPVYRFDGSDWAAFGTLPREGAFLPVAADVGPDGLLYVLEREFLGLRGFASRVTRYQIGAAGAEEPETVMQSAPGAHDNLEGLSVWQDSTGAIRLTMISDDNFKFYQTTEIVDYRLSR